MGFPFRLGFNNLETKKPCHYEDSLVPIREKIIPIMVKNIPVILPTELLNRKGGSRWIFQLMLPHATDFRVSDAAAVVWATQIKATNLMFKTKSIFGFEHELDLWYTGLNLIRSQ